MNVHDSPIVQRADSLDALALKINAEFAVAEQGQRQAIAAYRSIGQALIEAKEKCGHGKWLPWLKKNVPFSEGHARKYMRLAKSVTVTDLESAWRIITGRGDQPDADESEPEETPQSPASPAPSLYTEPEADEEAEEVEPEEPEPSPLPSASVNGTRDYPARNGQKKKSRPPAHQDAGHPYADVLKDFVALATKVSKLVNDSEPDSRLRQYLLHAGFVYPRAKIVGDRNYRWQVLALRPFYRVISLAGRSDKRPLTKSEILQACAEAIDPNSQDGHS